MLVKYGTKMENLFKLTGEIGTLAETDARYEEVYQKLSDALDAAEDTGLIKYEDDGS